MPDGNAAQNRLIIDQALDAAVVRFQSERPRSQEPALHPLVKWLVGAIAALGLAAMIGGGTWLVTSVSEMQMTLVRMDERMASGAIKDSRYDEMNRRVTNLEAYHQGGKQ